MYSSKMCHIYVSSSEISVYEISGNLGPKKFGTSQNCRKFRTKKKAVDFLWFSCRVDFHVAGLLVRQVGGPHGCSLFLVLNSRKFWTEILEASILRWTTQENPTVSWCNIGRRDCWGATLFPHFDFQAGKDFWWPRLEVYPLTLQEGVPIGVDEPTLTSPRFGPRKTNSKSPRGMGRTPFTYRSPQLRLSGSLFRLHQGDILGGKRDGISWRSIHQTGGCKQMWMSPSWPLSWANGSHWWRR